MVCTSCCRGVEEFARCVFTVLSLHSTRLVRAPWPPTVSGAPHDNEVFRVKAPGLSLLLVVSVATALETHPADQGAPTFESTVARYSQLRVGPGSIAMPGLHFVQGHLTGVPEVVPEIVPGENRNDEGCRWSASVHDAQGLHAVSERQLLGNRDAGMIARWGRGLSSRPADGPGFFR